MENLDGFKSNKAITLIALIITIIVLLILAGVTINSIMGHDDSMAKAREAKILSEEGEIDDALSVCVMMIKTKALITVTDKSNYYKDEETFVEVGQFDDNIYQITSYEYSEENRKVVLTIAKKGGTGAEITFEIVIDTGIVTYKSYTIS